MAYEKLKEAHYQYVLDAQWDHYTTFLDNNEKKRYEDPSGTLNYYDVGEGPLVFCFPGSTGKAMTYIEYLEELSSRYRVISIDYPVSDHIDKLVAFLIRFIESFEEAPRYCFANSFGVVLAQLIILRKAKIFDKIIFLHGMSKDTDISKKTIKIHRKSLNNFTKSIKNLRYTNFQKRFSNRIKKSINIFPDDTSKRLFWEGLYEEMLYDTSKEELLSNYGFMRDFWMEKSFKHKDFASVESQIFIIESESDHALEMDEKRALKALFPNSKYKIIKGDTHLSLIKNKDELVTLIEILFSN